MTVRPGDGATSDETPRATGNDVAVTDRETVIVCGVAVTNGETVRAKDAGATAPLPEGTAMHSA